MKMVARTTARHGTARFPQQVSSIPGSAQDSKDNTDTSFKPWQRLDQNDSFESAAIRDATHPCQTTRVRPAREENHRTGRTYEFGSTHPVPLASDTMIPSETFSQRAVDSPSC